MKKLLCTAFWLLMGIICFAQNYELKGNIVGLECDTILLVKVKGGVFEGAKIKVDNGIFSYKDQIGEPYFIQIFKLNNTGETDGKLTEFLVEPGLITVNGKSDSYENVSVKGSKSDLILKTYLKEDQKMVEEWEQLKISYNQYAAQNDTINQKTLAMQLNDILFNERIPLLKKYVKANRTNIVGALLPNFCNLKTFLKKEDYVEMYNLLTNKMKTSDYAKSTLKRSEL